MNYEHWTVMLETTGQARLADFMRAVILTSSQITSTSTWGNPTYWDWTYSAEIMVKVPKGQFSRFEETAKCKLKPVPKVSPR